MARHLALFTARGLTLFALFFFSVGFTLGTGLLIGPLRMVLERMRASDVSTTVERLVVVAAILLLVAVTALVARLLAIVALEKPKAVGAVLLVVCLATAAGANVLWMSPHMRTFSGTKEETVARFTFGPYPDEAKLRQLKEQGYTAVVPLLHPAVVPFEPQLLAAEVAAAREVGIEIIHTPMLPWISDNDASLEKLRQLAREPEGKYYVHCYLGKDRVLTVKRLIEKAGAAGTTESVGNSRSLEKKKKFERGQLLKLADEVWLTPYPTEGEFLSYVLNGNFVHVVALLHPDDKEDGRTIEAERKVTAAHDVPFLVIPLDADRYEPADVLAAVGTVKALQGPRLVHDYFGVDDERAHVARAFEDAWRTGRAPLLRSLEGLELKAGKVSRPAVHVAVGPRPDGREFGGALHRAGVRTFLCVAAEAVCKADDEVVRPYGMRVDRVATSALAERVAGNGTYYVYGASPAAITAALGLPGTR